MEENTSMAKILIVEDEATLNDAYSIILKRQNHDVISAFNGQEALDIIKKQFIPDLILLDLRMPKMDGVEFLENLQPITKYPNMKIIIFSNYDVQKDIDEAFKLGATRYMLKAFASPKELIRIVNDTLENGKVDK